MMVVDRIVALTRWVAGVVAQRQGMHFRSEADQNGHPLLVSA